MRLLPVILGLCTLTPSVLSDCVINLDSILTDPAPMIIDRSNRIIYPESGSRTLTILEKGQIALFCHGTAKKPSLVDKTYTPALTTNTSYVPLTCTNGAFVYDVNQQKVDVTTATCTYAQQPEMYKTFQPCASVGADGRTSGLDQLFTAKISWNISGSVTTQIEICADEKVYGTLWSKYTLRGKSINFRDTNGPRPTFRTDTTSENRFFGKTTTTGVGNAYTKASEADFAKKLFLTNNVLYGTSTVIIDTTGGSHYLARGHLAPDANFIYNVEQYATYYFMNVVPQFQSFNNGNWKSLEASVRSYAATHQKDVTVYTGTLGVLEYPNNINLMTPYYLMSLSSQLYLPVPKYMWTMVYNKDEGEAILFIGVNNPYVGASPGLDFCPSVCSATTGITKDFNVVDKGPFVCCKVDQELRNKIPSLPNVADANSNWPNLITAL